MKDINEVFGVRTSKGLVDMPKLRDAIEALGDPKTPGFTAVERKHLLQQARKMLVMVFAKKEMSLREFESAVSNAVYTASPDGQQYSSPPNANYWYVRDIYPEESYAVVEIGNLKVCFKIPFTLEDGVVTLSDSDKWVKVELKWVEVDS